MRIEQIMVQKATNMCCKKLTKTNVYIRPRERARGQKRQVRRRILHRALQTGALTRSYFDFIAVYDHTFNNITAN